MTVQASCCSECSRPKVRGSNKYCEWHRHMRTTLTAQVVAARQREKAAAGEYRTDAPHAADEVFCRGCQSVVPLFYSKGRACLACAYQRDREARVRASYGLAAPDLRRLEEKQGGRCAICGARPHDKALAVDHDHLTGDVRGLLCSDCNHKLIGRGAHESARRLLIAAWYLLNPPGSANGTWQRPEALDFYVTTERRER